MLKLSNIQSHAKITSFIWYDILDSLVCKMYCMLNFTNKTFHKSTKRSINPLMESFDQIDLLPLFNRIATRVTVIDLTH